MLAPKITALKPEPPHTLVVTFETGEVRLFDLTPHLEWGVFQELRPYELFKEAKADRWGVTWPTGQDLSRHTLYDEGVPVAPARAPDDAQQEA